MIIINYSFWKFSFIDLYKVSASDSLIIINCLLWKFSFLDLNQFFKSNSWLESSSTEPFIIWIQCIFRDLNQFLLYWIKSSFKSWRLDLNQFPPTPFLSRYNAYYRFLFFDLNQVSTSDSLICIKFLELKIWLKSIFYFLILINSLKSNYWFT